MDSYRFAAGLLAGASAALKEAFFAEH